MTVLGCAQLREVAPELALGILGGAERADAVLHVTGCASCQLLVAELAEAADALPTLAPEVEPPPDFEAGVVARLREPFRRARRRWVASIAAAVAFTTIVSITAVRVIESGSDDGPVAAPHVASAPVEVTMMRSSGAVPVGWAYVTDRRSIAVSVSYAMDAGTYLVQLGDNPGVSTTLGTMRVGPEGRGSWTGRSPVRIPHGGVLTLVDQGGAEVCRGTLA